MGILSSAIVSPMYVILTNPLSRLEVIMQTNSIKNNSISTLSALNELKADMIKNGMKGLFRGRGVSIGKAIISLTLFHEGRLFLQDQIKKIIQYKFRIRYSIYLALFLIFQDLLFLFYLNLLDFPVYFFY